MGDGKKDRMTAGEKELICSKEHALVQFEDGKQWVPLYVSKFENGKTQYGWKVKDLKACSAYTKFMEDPTPPYNPDLERALANGLPKKRKR